MTKKKLAMDDAERWIGEIARDLKEASELIQAGFDHGNWGPVQQALGIIRKTQNHLSNMGHLAQSDNWRILAERNGVTYDESEE